MSPGRFFSNLQFKLAAVFLAVALVPLGIVGAYSVGTADRVIADIVTNQLENMAAEKQQLLQRWLAERRADLEVIAASSIVRNMQREAIAPYMESVRREYMVYQRFVVLEADGRTIYDSEPDAVAAAADEAWRAEVRDGRRYMSSITRSQRDQESVFRLTAPIVDAQGHVLGGVCATVSTASILEWVLRVAMGETGECYLVDQDGTFLAHQDPRRILHDNIAHSGSFANIFRPAGPRPIYTDYRGIEVLGATRPIANTQWHVVVEQDCDEAFAPAFKLQRAILLAGLLTFVVAGGGSLALATYLTAPLRMLDAAARALARGDFQVHLSPAALRRSDEIGGLHRAFAEMARQLHDRQVRLESRVDQTQARLQQADERLQHTMAAAARSEQLATLGRLASGVAHEIRTPLASLKLYLQSVDDELAHSPDLSEDYAIAMRQVERIETTINQFLGFARPAEPVRVEINFRRLVDEALAMARPRAKQQNVALEVQVAEPLPAVRGDMRQLNEALVNLLVNALEEMPHGGRLSITVDSQLPPDLSGPCARIVVADSGPGIAPADQDRIFEPFFTTKASGSGLGLAIVRGTVERHGGTLRLQSALGAGAAFSIYLPAT